MTRAALIRVALAGAESVGVQPGERCGHGSDIGTKR